MDKIDLSEKIHLLEPNSAYNISPPREVYPRPMVRQVWDLLGREVDALLTWDWPAPPPEHEFDRMIATYPELA